jgi:hypothetical protein
MASEPVFHPAAEIVAIALKKICKVANSRKYSKLHEECRLFLDELHLIIPAAGTAGGTRLLVYGRSDTGSTTDLASQAAATAGTSRRASVDGRSAAAAPTPTPPPEEEATDTGTAKPPAADEAQAGGAGAPQDADAPPPAHEGATPTAEGQDAAGPAPEAAAEAPSGASAQADAAATAAPAPAPARPPPPPEPELPDLVPRTATALPDPVCDRILGIFRLAVDTQRPEVIEVALDCIQKLVAFRFMQVRGLPGWRPWCRRRVVRREGMVAAIGRFGQGRARGWWLGVCEGHLAGPDRGDGAISDELLGGGSVGQGGAGLCLGLKGPSWLLKAQLRCREKCIEKA